LRLDEFLPSVRHPPEGRKDKSGGVLISDRAEKKKGLNLGGKKLNYSRKLEVILIKKNSEEKRDMFERKREGVFRYKIEKKKGGNGVKKLAMGPP